MTRDEAKRLLKAEAEALLWELCYRLEAGEWFLEDFPSELIERLAIALQLRPLAREGGSDARD